MQKIIEVALPTGSLNQTFSYLAECKEEEIIEGRRVLVPFGAGRGKQKVGTAFAIQKDNVKKADLHKFEEENGYKLKKIIKFLDEKPIFEEKTIKLLRWMSGYYHCTLGEVFRAAVPVNVFPGDVEGVQILKMPDADELNQMAVFAPDELELLQYLKPKRKPTKLTDLRKHFPFKISDDLIARLANKGYIEKCSNVDAAIKKKKADAVQISKKIAPHEIPEILASIEKRAPKQHAILELLSELDKPILQAEALRTTNSSAAAINALVKKKIVEKFKVEVDRETESSGSLARRDESKLNLTDEQKFALDSLKTAIDTNEFKPFLLHGVTGSGKTLIYIHAIAHAVAQGKSAILLVPEISLTPQLLDRFERVFPGKIATLHSALSEGLRMDAFDKIVSGEKNIVIGARSAIFAPVKDLGLIIVDEEHETSYKQNDPQPRYHGRDTAVMRASYENAVCLLGSATPAFETMYNAKNGKYELLRITQRADKAVMPEVEIIDMLDARRAGKVHGSFSFSLINEIVAKLRKKEGIILFLNRRGYAPFVECQQCGHIPICKHCDVTLTLHKKKKKLVCHHCGYTEKLPPVCPECKSELNEVGVGTQRVEEDLAEVMKDYNLSPAIQRIDLDTTRKKGAFRKILTDFSEGNTDILIGTQMVAKGLDFGRCTLVGVINADLQLFIDDFRSSERTFQLLTQVSGRAGRSKDKGSVIIQTNHPDNPAVIKAKRADYESFYDFEIKSRKQTLFPPFSRFCVIEFASPDYHQVRHGSTIFRNALPNHPSIIAFDPIEPFLAKVKDTYRILVPLKGLKEQDPGGAILRNSIRAALTTLRNEKLNKLTVKVDIDSYSVM